MQPLLISFFGGALIGLATATLLFFNGKIAGISGILGGILRPQAGDTSWRVSFLGGLLVGGILLLLFRPEAFGTGEAASMAVLAVGGLLVGVGTKMSNGCTSGHGVCGIARLSPRSLVATGVFMATAMVVVYVTRHVLGGSA
jgi:uncharacterized protein